LFPEEKQFFQGKQMFFSEFFCARHNVFQPEGYIFLGFHPLTYHKPLHFDGFCFILPLKILLISWPLGWPFPGGAGDSKGAAPLWPQFKKKKKLQSTHGFSGFFSKWYLFILVEDESPKMEDVALWFF
jgi:hypothetical protein